MYKVLTQWLVGRAAERGEPLPAWLRSVVDRDPSLAAFEAASRRLGPELRRDATPWVQRTLVQETEEHKPTPTRRAVRAGSRPAPPRSLARRFAWPLATCAAAAGLMLAVALAMRNDERDSVAGNDGSQTREQQVVPIAAADRDQLLAAWDAGQTSMIDLRNRMQRMSLRVPLPAQAPSASLFREVERAGDATERAVARWDARVATRRQELAADVKSACRFFTRRLPTSLALVMGLENAAVSGGPATGEPTS